MRAVLQNTLQYDHRSKCKRLQSWGGMAWFASAAPASWLWGGARWCMGTVGEFWEGSLGLEGRARLQAEHVLSPREASVGRSLHMLQAR